MMPIDRSKQQYIFFDAENKKLHDVPIWKLFIDKVCHKENDEMYFDRGANRGTPEPGYNAAMNNAFAYMLTNLYKELDANEFKKLHHLCITGVHLDVFQDRENFHPGSYGIDLRQVTEEAQKEWESDKLISTQKENQDQYLSSLESLSSRRSLVLSSYSDKEDEEIIKKLNDLFTEYYSEMKKTTNNDDKLSAIVSLCRKLEIGHFFNDGNQRTIVFVILNKLLIENHFSPVILEDPIVFDGLKSKDELVGEVKIGMEYFASLIPSNKSVHTYTQPDNEMEPNRNASTLSRFNMFNSTQAAPSVASNEDNAQNSKNNILKR